MFETVKPKINIKPTAEKEHKIMLSALETRYMKFRPIYCPICNFKMIDVFEDIAGHFAVKCQRCKAVVPINAAYFRTSRRAAYQKRAYHMFNTR